MRKVNSIMSEVVKSEVAKTEVVKKVSFWRIFFASLAAGAILSIIGWIFWLVILGGLMSSEEKSFDSAVLHLKLDGNIAERSSSKFDPSSFGVDKSIGLSDILYGLEKAKTDNNVKGVFLELGTLSCGAETAYEIRAAIKDFQTSKKFVVAYLGGEVITQKQYFIASAAPEIYGFPTSAMEFLGLGTELMFYKTMFDKVGLEMQVIRGPKNDFKSAVEPYFRDNMSDSSKLQLQRYIQNIWSDMLVKIGLDRKIAPSELNLIADNAQIQRVDDAIRYKLIDAAKYQDEVEALVAKKAKLDDLSDIQSFEEYAKESFKMNQLLTSPNSASIAVIVAEGAITVDGEEVNSKKLCADFAEVRANDNIKAVVFRVNSPGGSALASEEIWREVNLTAKTKKVIVSMGDYAASGGYYIAAPAHYIFAEKSTLTGSIGVFGVVPFTGKMLENNFGLRFDQVATNKHSVLSLNRKLTPEEMAMLENQVSITYTQFKNRVATGRGLTMEQVERIARGRVWTGEDALNCKLVDKIGNMTDAINYAKKITKVTNAKVIYYPIQKEAALDKVLEELSKQESKVSVKDARIKKELSFILNQVYKLEEMTGIQMRLPYEIRIN